jgi:hypothetical protein
MYMYFGDFNGLVDVVWNDSNELLILLDVDVTFSKVKQAT